ncbi:MAG TPA: YkgJ family cysteine cluster protein [Aliidongia sp.]|nr:YkgJ family cysteine cluster protein [Aliidongia sp.]
MSTTFSEAERAYLTAVGERAMARLDAVPSKHGKRPGLALALAAERLAALGDEMAPIFPAMAAAGTPVACAKGCGSCCTLTIDTTPDEVFGLIRHLEASLPPDALAALKERARTADAQGHGVPALARHRLKISCPVLDPETQDCLGHAARPTGCQGYLSLNLARCLANHETSAELIPQPTVAALLRDIVLEARRRVLAAAGLATPALELTAALVAAWADPAAEQRWLDGESVLGEAAMPGSLSASNE